MRTADDLELVELQPENATRVLLENIIAVIATSGQRYVVALILARERAPKMMPVQSGDKEGLGTNSTHTHGMHSPPVYADKACWPGLLGPEQLAGPTL